MRYDLIVLGDDDHGQQAALAAAQLRKRVALIKHCHDGGEGNIARRRAATAKSLREAALLLTRVRQREVAPELLACRGERMMRQWEQLAQQVATQETLAADTQLRELGVDCFAGPARFIGPHEIEVANLPKESCRLSGDRILIAVGARPLRPSWVPFDSETIFESDDIWKIDHLPKSMIVVGGGVIGLESAMIFAVLGTRVAVVDAQTRLLEFCDRGVTRLLRQCARRLGVRFRLGRAVNAIEKTLDQRAVVRLEGDRRLLAECVLYASGWRGNTDSLNLAVAGLMPDEHGRIWCNEHGQTWIKHIYGIGEVVGFPTFSNAVLDQGRRAVLHAFDQQTDSSDPVSYGLITIPELAMTGATEQQLRHDLVAYESGVARIRSDSRGHSGGAASGMLKLLFHRESLQLLGVHCLGESAHELIRIGQSVMSRGGTIESFRRDVFGEGAMFECYRLAAENGFAHLSDRDEDSQTARRRQHQPLRIWRPCRHSAISRL